MDLRSHGSDLLLLRYGEEREARGALEEHKDGRRHREVGPGERGAEVRRTRGEKLGRGEGRRCRLLGGLHGVWLLRAEL